MIFHNAIPQNPVQPMSSRFLLILNEDAMSMLKPCLLLFSVHVSYQTSNNIHSVSQKLAHNKHKHNQQN